MKKQEHFDFYGKVVQNDDFTDSGWADNAKAEQRYVAVVEKLTELGSAKVLDYGCGVGHLSKYVLDALPFTSYTGADMYPYFVEKAKQLYGGIGANFVTVSGTELDAQIDEVDTVVCIGTYSMRCSLTSEEYKDFFLGQLQEMLDRDIEHIIIVGFRKLNDFEDEHLFYTDVNALMKLADDNGVKLTIDNTIPYNFIATFSK